MAKPLRLCPKCQTNTISRGPAKVCNACYLKRGSRPELKKKYLCTHCGGEATTGSSRGLCRRCYDVHRKGFVAAKQQPHRLVADDAIERSILDELAKGAKSTAQLAQSTNLSGEAVSLAIDALKHKGLNVHDFGGQWSLERYMPVLERTFEYVSRPDNTYHFGVSSDQHLCSKYAREDVVNDLYDAFQMAGVDRVFNAGNWIDGEDEKNKYDISVHGFEPQINYLVDRYPKRDGITTYSIWGEDHEGWYSRREAIDVGRFAEGKMRTAKRTDWVDLGFVEARVDLINANTGARSTLVVMHPGGGSSYAYSYRPQKIVESLSGGEKPAILLIGHYHKLSCHWIRNVWTIQAGCGQDQSVFMRKKGLEAHVGGHIVTVEQDPKTGAIFRCVSDQRAYFDRAYYNDRWSKTTAVVQTPRFMGGVVPVAR